MSLLINNIKCDAFAHIDKRTVSNTVKFSLSERDDSLIVAFLFCDDKVFPVSTTVTAECCIKGVENKMTVNCSIGNSGEIIIPIPDEFRVVNERLSCEINISGVDSDNLAFRYKAANFIVAVTE